MNIARAALTPLIQAASDSVLGWTVARDGTHYY
jgi:hypothetical protein